MGLGDVGVQGIGIYTERFFFFEEEMFLRPGI